MKERKIYPTNFIEETSLFCIEHEIDVTTEGLFAGDSHRKSFIKQARAYKKTDEYKNRIKKFNEEKSKR